MERPTDSDAVVQASLTSFADQLVKSSDDVDRMLELVARRAAETVGDGAALLLLDEDGEHLRLAAVYHPDPETRADIEGTILQLPRIFGEGLSGEAALRRESWLLGPDDVAEEQSRLTEPALAGFVRRHPTTGLLITPMVSFGELVGVLAVVRLEPSKPYDDADVAVVEALAERAAIAVIEAKRPPGHLTAREYEAIYLHSIDGVLFTIPDGTILAANPAACEILGWSESDIIRLGGRKLLALGPDEQERMAAERAAAWTYRAELPWRRQDGSVFIADTSSALFISASGEPRACVIFRDVTEQVEARERMAAQHRALGVLDAVTAILGGSASLEDAASRMLECLSDGFDWPVVRIAVRDPEGGPPRVWTTDPDDDTDVGEFTARTAIWQALADAEETHVFVPIVAGARTHGELRLRCREVRERDETVIATLLEIGARLGGALEHWALEARLRQIDQDRSMFVARAAHELRGPVSALVIAVDVLSETAATTERTKQLLGVVQRSTEHLQSLVDRLLDLSIIERGTFELHIESVPVRHAVERALEQIQAEGNASMRVEIEQSLQVEADETALGEILTNLASNAVRYGGNIVTITGRQENGMAVVTVADNGPGVDPAIEDSLFEPFVRGAGHHNRGAGLGLPFAAQLARSMRGDIRYARGGDGGSEFTVELPLAIAPETPTASSFVR